MKQTKSNTSKSNARIASLEKKFAGLSTNKTKAPKKRPFATAGEIAGRGIGSMFGNANMGAGVGKWLGSGIGSIFGSGDYTMSGPVPSYNVLASSKQIPQFSTNSQTNIVCHREYLGDIFGTSNFNNQQYPLNPGMSQTFPWLSSVADSYQEYKFHGLIFEFRSLVTDFVTGGAPGVVVMATNYNADVPNYATKQQMENSEFAVSVKPTSNLIHGVECAMSQTILPQRYVRNGSVPSNQDLRLYDYGTFQFATSSNPVSQDLGELWVSYCVEFFKPILPIDVAPSPETGHSTRTGVTNLTPLGSTSFLLSGNIGLSVNTTVAGWTAIPGQNYIATFSWQGTAVAGTAFPPLLSTPGLTALNYFVNGSASNQNAGLGLTTGSMVIEFAFTCTLVNPGIVSMIFGTTGVLPSSSTIDLVVSQLDKTAN